MHRSHLVHRSHCCIAFLRKCRAGQIALVLVPVAVSHAIVFFAPVGTQHALQSPSSLQRAQNSIFWWHGVRSALFFISGGVESSVEDIVAGGEKNETAGPRMDDTAGI
jgi:hypothetical protein